MPEQLIIGPLPPGAEHLIRGAIEKLAASRNHFKSRHVQEARELLELVLKEYGQLPWPPVRATKHGKPINPPDPQP